MENQTKEGRPVQENPTFYSFVSGLGIGTFIWTKLLRFQYRLGFVLNLGIALGLVLGIGIVVLLDIWFVLALGFSSMLGIWIWLGSIKYTELSTELSRFKLWLFMVISLAAESKSAPKMLPSDLAVAFTLGLVSAVVSWSGFWYGWVLGILLGFGYEFLIKKLGYKSQFGVGTEPKDEASEIDGHIALSESRLTQNANEHFEEAKEMIPQRKGKSLGIMTRNQPEKCSSTEGKIV